MLGLARWIYTGICYLTRIFLSFKEKIRWTINREVLGLALVLVMRGARTKPGLVLRESNYEPILESGATAAPIQVLLKRSA